MGLLVEQGTGRKFTLGARCILGRHPGCDLRIDDPRASSEHASVRWTGDSWELRDLGSRNGTYLGGRRLQAAERVALAEGLSFTLGGVDVGFTLVDGSPPVACARNAKGDVVRTAKDGLLVLPDDARPWVSIFQDIMGNWVAESDEATLPVADHEVLVVGGDAWTLELPGAVSTTWESRLVLPTLETIQLRLGVSRDEEHVEVTVIHEDKATTLPPRSHHYLLVVLARARLGDRDLQPERRGWVTREALCKMLGTDANRLNVDIYRARKQLGSLGVLGAVDLILRRPSTAEVRLGTDRVEIVSL